MNDIQTQEVGFEILENKNVEPVQGFFVYSPVFPTTLQKIPSFAIFIPEPRNPVYE